MNNEKLRILLNCSILEVTKLSISTQLMHNLYAIFANFLDICKQIAGIH